MMFRPQRGGFEESMAEAVYVDPAEFLQFIWSRYGGPGGVVEVSEYDAGYDSRNDWRTHIVTVNGEAVGFTDRGL